MADVNAPLELEQPDGSRRRVTLEDLRGPAGAKGDPGTAGAKGDPGTAGAKGDPGTPADPGLDYLYATRSADAYTVPRSLVGTNAGWTASGTLMAQRLHIVKAGRFTRVRYRPAALPTTLTEFRLALITATPDGIVRSVLAQTAGLSGFAVGGINTGTAVRVDALDVPVDLAPHPAVPVFLAQRIHWTGGSPSSSCGPGVSGGVGSLDDVDDLIPQAWGINTQPQGPVTLPLSGTLNRGISIGSPFWYELLP